jgi:hypothetical protein
VKLIRLVRLPRIIKVLNVENFKQQIKQIKIGGTRAKNIAMKIHINKVYSISRLILITLILVYFIAVLFGFGI